MVKFDKLTSFDLYNQEEIEKARKEWLQKDIEYTALYDEEY